MAEPCYIKGNVMNNADRVKYPLTASRFMERFADSVRDVEKRNVERERALIVRQTGKLDANGDTIKLGKVSKKQDAHVIAWRLHCDRDRTCDRTTVKVVIRQWDSCRSATDKTAQFMRLDGGERSTEYHGDYAAQFNAPHKAPKPKAHKGPNPWHSRRKAPMPVIERV